MALIYKDRVQETTTTTGTGTLTLAGAVTGFQSFSAIGNANTCIYALEDANGSGWEVGIGTYTSSGTTLARTTVLASSNSGSAITLSAGTHKVYVTANAGIAQEAWIVPLSIGPGGRLTLESGVPVSVADQIEKTTVYYTPYKHGYVPLFDGNVWRSIAFTEKSLSLGTVTSGLCYDIFGYLNNNTLELEKLAWTNGATRSTPVTLQDGRYCKSSDKTRLLLGTIYTTSTTTTEDSSTNRLVGNVYNRENRSFDYYTGDAGHSYAVNTVRSYNNSNAHRVSAACSLNSSCFIFFGAYVAVPSISGTAELSAGVNSTTVAYSAFVAMNNGSAEQVRALGGGVSSLAEGYSYIQLVQRSTSGATATYSYGVIKGSVLS